MNNEKQMTDSAGTPQETGSAAYPSREDVLLMDSIVQPTALFNIGLSPDGNIATYTCTIKPVQQFTSNYSFFLMLLPDTFTGTTISTGTPSPVILRLRDRSVTGGSNNDLQWYRGGGAWSAVTWEYGDSLDVEIMVNVSTQQTAINVVKNGDFAGSQGYQSFNNNTYPFTEAGIRYVGFIQANGQTELTNFLPSQGEIPGTITDLAVVNENIHSIRLRWTAPGNQGDTGTAARYDIRYATFPINELNWDSANTTDVTILPSEAGTVETFQVLELDTDVTYSFAIKTIDDAGLESELSNVVSGTTKIPVRQSVTVNSIETLRSAINTAPPEGLIITLAAGTYHQGSVTINFDNKDNITVQGETDNYDDTVIIGPGINNSSLNISMRVNNSSYITVQNLTIRDTYYHAVQVNLGSAYFRAYNLKTWDNGESGFKVTSGRPYADYGIVENCYIGFTTTGMRGVIEGIDGVACKGWIARLNTFVNVKHPTSVAYGSFFKGNSINSVMERNFLIDCDVALSFGGGGSDPNIFRYDDTTYEHRGGIIRNNVVWNTRATAIYMNSAYEFKVFNNTVWQPVEVTDNSIDSRFNSDGTIINNICSGRIRLRDGGQAVIQNNIEYAQASLFVDQPNGNFYLAPTAATAIDRGADLSPDVTDDFNGTARPIGAGYDIGAFEVDITV